MLASARVSVVLLVALLAACSQEHAAESGAELAQADLSTPASATKAPKGTALAYEHHVEVELPGARIAERIAGVRDACFAQRHGDCAVLQVEQRGGEYPGGSIKVRIAPDGVEPLVRIAAQGGDVIGRNLTAEDLAEVIEDNTLRRERLTKEHARLLEFQSRPGLKVADMLELSKRLADIETGLDAANREQAQHRRRIDTNLLTLRFSPTGVEVGSSGIGEAFRDVGLVMSSSVAWLVRLVAALIPVAVLVGIPLWFWRRGRRRARLPEGPPSL